MDTFRCEYCGQRYALDDLDCRFCGARLPDNPPEVGVLQTQFITVSNCGSVGPAFVPGYPVVEIVNWRGV